MSGGTDILQAHGDPSPRVLWKCSLEDFDQYKKNLDEEADPVREKIAAKANVARVSVKLLRFCFIIML